MNLKQINVLVTRFREAIEKCDRRVLFPSFENFPYGSCGEATVLLGIYLEEKGCGIFDKVRSRCPESWHGVDSPWFHSWLKQDNVIVDITADQFEGVNERIIVSVNSTWHKQFTEQEISSCRAIFQDDEDWLDERAKFASNYYHIVSILGKEPGYLFPEIE